MKSSSDSLPRSRFTRRTATVTISAPLASRARAVSWKDLYFPVPTIRRERKERPAMINDSDMDACIPFYLFYNQQHADSEIIFALELRISCGRLPPL